MSMHTVINNEPEYYARTHSKKDFSSGEQKEVLDFILNHAPGGTAKLLELGGGNGEIIPFLPDKIQYWGIEPMEYSVRALRKLVPDPERIIQGVAENLPFADSFFDYIFSITVVEHVYDPSKALAEMVRVVKAGGYIIIICPNHETPWSTLAAVRHYSEWQKRVLLLNRWGDLFKRMFGILTFRVIPQNFTQATGRYERADDDLKYIVSAFEIATFLKRHGCDEVRNYRFTGKKGGLKDRVKRLLTYIPALRWWGGGVFLIFKKNSGNTS